MIVYLTYVLIVAVDVWLFRTRWGLRTRAVGEHPKAADTVGIKVLAMRYRNVIIGGAIAGLGGSYFIFQVGQFQKNITSGQGFIALAALIFGRWSPRGAVAAALLFGFASAMQVTLSINAPSIPSDLHGDAALHRHDRRGGRAGREGPRAGGRRRAVRQGVSGGRTRFDWEALRAERRRGVAARVRAVLPLPGRRGGAADDGRVLVGCNVENAAYGVVLCAECGVVELAARDRWRAADARGVRERRRRRDHAVRPLPAAAVGARRRRRCS